MENSDDQFGDPQNDVNQLVEEETDKVIHHISAKLPKDVIDRLDMMGGLKEKLYQYFNRNFQDMLNRYMIGAEDDMGKSIRGWLEKAEKAPAPYAPRDIGELLNKLGGADRFNTGELEKSLVNMYGRLQEHIQQGITELESQTNGLLNRNSDTAAFIRGDNSYTLVKCAFTDNPQRPKTVTDLKIVINVLESELISPIFHYQATAEYLIKDLLSKNIIDTIDDEIERLRDERLDGGLEELSDAEIVFNKLGKVEDFTDDNTAQAKAKRYSQVAKGILDRLRDLRTETTPPGYDPLSIRENLKKIIDSENIRDRGFNTAVNSLTSILENAHLGFQFIENFKNARELIIREYDETDPAALPDESYQLSLRYYDGNQIAEARKAYDVQMKSFETEVLHVWDIIHVIYEDRKSPFRVCDFQDLTLKTQERVRKLIKSKTGEPLYGDIEKPWDGLNFVKPGETDVERMNRTYVYEKENISRRIAVIREMAAEIYGYGSPIERRTLEDQLNFLEKEYLRFKGKVNPYHLHPGLVLEADITSIKRKKFTLDAMSKALNEFLQSVSKGFRDASFRSRRISVPFTERPGGTTTDNLQDNRKHVPKPVTASVKAYLDTPPGDFLRESARAERKRRASNTPRTKPQTKAPARETEALAKAAAKKAKTKAPAKKAASTEAEAKPPAKKPAAKKARS